jgi:hypothetical protein
MSILDTKNMPDLTEHKVPDSKPSKPKTDARSKNRRPEKALPRNANLDTVNFLLSKGIKRKEVSKVLGITYFQLRKILDPSLSEAEVAMKEVAV